MNQIEYQKKIIREEYMLPEKRDIKNYVLTNNLKMPFKKNRVKFIEK